MNSRRTLSHACTAALAVGLFATSARAEEQHGGAGTVYDRGSYPYAELVKQPLTLSATLLRVDVPARINLTKDEVGKPWSLPLAADVGVTNDLQVGVFHETGLCLAGKENGCAKTYDDVGARAAVSLARQPEAQFAVEAAVLAYDFASTSYSGSLALAYKRTLGNLALVVDAGVVGLLNKRSEALVKETAFADGEVQFQLGEGLAAFGIVGVAKAIDTASGVTSHLAAPVSVGLEYEPIHKVDVGVELGFPNLLGQDATADERELLVLLRLFI